MRERKSRREQDADASSWFHQTTHQAIDKEGDKYKVLDVLARKLGILGIFSDWRRV